GVALVPGFLAGQALASGELTVADEGVLPVGEAYYFSYPAHDRPSEALLAFAAWLRIEAALSAGAGTRPAAMDDAATRASTRDGVGPMAMPRPGAPCAGGGAAHWPG